LVSVLEKAKGRDRALCRCSPLTFSNTDTNNQHRFTGTDTNNQHRPSFALTLPLHSRRRCAELRDLNRDARRACRYA
jgi:hypothetical protein